MGEIVKLVPKKEGELKSLTIHHEKICLHEQVEVNVDERQLRCLRCNSVIDPFEFIYSWAISERNQTFVRQELKLEIKTLTEIKERLTKDVNNLKAANRKIGGNNDKYKPEHNF